MRRRAFCSARALATAHPSTVPFNGIRGRTKHRVFTRPFSSTNTHHGAIHLPSSCCVSHPFDLSAAGSNEKKPFSGGDAKRPSQREDQEVHDPKKNEGTVRLVEAPLMMDHVTSTRDQTVLTLTLPLEDDGDGRADHDLHLHLTSTRPQKHQKEQGELLPSQLLFGDSLYEDLTDPDDQGNPQDWLSTNAPISLTEDHVEEIERREEDCRIFVNRTAE